MEEKGDSGLKNGYFQRFLIWAKKYWGGNSVGVRNWLAIMGIALMAGLFLLSPLVVATVPAAILLGLLITAGAVVSKSIVAALAALKFDLTQGKLLSKQDDDSAWEEISRDQQAGFYYRR
jgi:hypothetical protein